jgi:molybdopterin converting factor subunit 1
MISISIRLYAGLRDLVGARDLQMELPEGATIDQLRTRLGEEHPAVLGLLPTLVCAVDEEYVVPEHVLRDGDHVALIPPVSGGR